MQIFIKIIFKKNALTFAEILLSCFILAIALIPIADFLSKTTKATKEDKCEAEALQFACDLMDYILFKMPYSETSNLNGSQSTLIRGQTEIRYKIEASPVKWEKVKSFQLKYHDPCPNGAENNNLDSDVIEYDDKLTTLDKEVIEMNNITNANNNDFNLCDIKVIVEWRPYGVTDDNAFRKNPIMLYSRKARL